jgi:hypothetical protein
MSNVPTFIPILAYPDSDYPAGDDPWAETPRAVEPSSGGLESGMTPGGQIPAQYYNYMFQSLGRHIDAVADAHAFSPRAEPVFAETHCSLSNGRGAVEPLVHNAGDGHWIVRAVPDGGELFFKSHAFMGLDPGINPTLPKYILAADVGFTYPTDPGILAARSDGVGIIAVAIDADPGTCRYTTDLGATWSAGGGITLDSGDLPKVGAFYDTKWWVFSADDSANDLLISSSTATPATWSNESLAVLAGYSDFVPRRVIRTPDAMLVVPDTDYGVAVYTPNGSGTGTWTAVAIEDTPSATAWYWRGAYNAQIERTLLVNVIGELYMADSECVHWTFVGTITGYELVDAVATGRGFLLSAHKATAPRESIFFVYQDYDKTWKWRTVLTIMPESDTVYGSSTGSFHFTRVEGRVIALRTPSTGIAEIEAYTFGTFPADAEYDRALSGW